jgi:hypothetical protein
VGIDYYSNEETRECGGEEGRSLLHITEFACLFVGLSFPWLYGSWIYNYICNQCLSPLMCETESRSERGIQHYVRKVVSNLRQFGGFLRVLRFPLFMSIDQVHRIPESINTLY